MEIAIERRGTLLIRSSVCPLSWRQHNVHQRAQANYALALQQHQYALITQASCQFNS